MPTRAPDACDEGEHVLGARGKFHLTDKPTELSR